MIPFPGESVILGNAVDLTSGSDGTLYTDIVAREGSRSLGPGGEWRAWVYPGEVDYLEEPGADVVVSFVVEILSGAGTLSAAWGFDPTYSDEAAATPNSLGTHVVAGTQTLVLTTTLSADDVLNHPDAFHLRLDGVSGTVEVQQVKLRVWPTAGIAGGWSELRDGFPTSWLDTAPWFAGFPFEGAATNADVEASWDGAWAAVAPTVPTGAPMTFTAISGFTLGGSVGQFRPGGTDYVTEVGINAIVALIPGLGWEGQFPIDPTLVEGVDWIRPPEEVAGDFAAYAEQVGVGSTEWDNAEVTVVVGGADVPLAGGPTFTSDAADLELTSGSGTITADVTLDLAGSLVASTGTSSSSVTLPLATGGRVIVAHFGHSTLVSPPGWPGTAPSVLSPIQHSSDASLFFGDIVTTEPIRTRAVLPTYRSWTAGIVPDSRVPKLRQIFIDDGRGTAPRGQFAGLSAARTRRAFGDR